MKRLKTQLDDLRDLFERSLTVRCVSEPLASFDNSTHTEIVRGFMEHRDFDVVGVREHGQVIGYVERNTIGGIDERPIGRFARSFDRNDSILADTAPFRELFDHLNEKPRVFVWVAGRVGGIAMRGDLQKTPVRMWLFSLVSLIEMHLLALVREYHVGGSWQKLLPQENLKNANRYFAVNCRANEAMRLEDCLSLGDKFEIVVGSPALRKALMIGSVSKADEFFKQLIKLRDRLAHSQDILHDSRFQLFDLVNESENLLERCERATGNLCEVNE